MVRPHEKGRNSNLDQGYLLDKLYNSYQVGKLWELAENGSPVSSLKMQIWRDASYDCPMLLHFQDKARDCSQPGCKVVLSRGAHFSQIQRKSRGRTLSSSVPIATCTSGMVSQQFCFPFECFRAHRRLTGLQCVLSVQPQISRGQLCPQALMLTHTVLHRHFNSFLRSKVRTAPLPIPKKNCLIFKNIQDLRHQHLLWLH